MKEISQEELDMTNVGEVIALNMLNGQVIQGRIKFVDVDARTVRLERPFLNGKPMGEVEKTFPIDTIAKFKILNVGQEPEEEEEEPSNEVPKMRKTTAKATSAAKGDAAVKDPTSYLKTSRAKALAAATAAVPAAAAAAAGDGPSKFLKESGAAAGAGVTASRASMKNESTEATTSTWNNLAKTGTVAVSRPEKAPYRPKQQQQQPQQQHSSCSSASGSTSSSPVHPKQDYQRDPINGIDDRLMKKGLSVKHGPARGNYASNRRTFYYGRDNEPRSPWMNAPPGRRRRVFMNRGDHCGIPELDSPHSHMRINKNNEDLSRPIDFDLNEDFDFEKNLEIFQKFKDEENRKDALQEKIEDDVEHKEAQAVGGQFSQMNYEHYQNVISDPARVTSWTTKANDRFATTQIVTTLFGEQIPFMKYSEKEKLLRKAEPYLGSDLFHVMIADRLMMFIWRVIDRFRIKMSEVVVIDSAAVNTFLTTMLLRHLSNRAYKTVVYSCLLGQYNLPHVKQVHDVKDLPEIGVQLIVVLGPTFLGTIKEWIKNRSPPAHVICIEKPLELTKNEHILMVGVGTEPDEPQKAKDPDCLRAVVDVGIPFSWVDERSATCLSRTFASKSIVMC